MKKTTPELGRRLKRATKENPTSETMSHHAIEFSSSSSLQKKAQNTARKNNKKGASVVPCSHQMYSLSLSFSFLPFDENNNNNNNDDERAAF